MALVDVNSDGWLDLVFGGGGATGATTVYLNRGNGAVRSTTTGGPTALLTWSLPSRFGMDVDGDGLVDYFTSTGAISPGTWNVNLNGCGSTPGTSAITGYEWTVGSTVVGTTCALTHPVDVARHATASSSRSPTRDGRFAEVATVGRRPRRPDRLARRLGGLRRGQPGPSRGASTLRLRDVAARALPPLGARGHRAGRGQLEQADPHTSVTFLHLACSGGRIEQIPTDVVASQARTSNDETAWLRAPGIISDVKLTITAANGTLSVFVDRSADKVAFTPQAFAAATAPGTRRSRST